MALSQQEDASCQEGIVRVLREQLHLQADELCKRELEAQLLHVQLQAAVERATEAAQQLVQLEQHVASLRAAANPDTVMQLEIWRLQREVQAHKLRAAALEESGMARAEQELRAMHDQVQQLKAELLDLRVATIASAAATSKAPPSPPSAPIVPSPAPPPTSSSGGSSEAGLSTDAPRQDAGDTEIPQPQASHMSGGDDGEEVIHIDLTQRPHRPPPLGGLPAGLAAMFGGIPATVGGSDSEQEEDQEQSRSSDGEQGQHRVAVSGCDEEDDRTPVLVMLPNGLLVPIAVPGGAQPQPHGTREEHVSPTTHSTNSSPASPADQPGQAQECSSVSPPPPVIGAPARPPGLHPHVPQAGRRSDGAAAAAAAAGSPASSSGALTPEELMALIQPAGDKATSHDVHGAGAAEDDSDEGEEEVMEEDMMAGAEVEEPVRLFAISGSFNRKPSMGGRSPGQGSSTASQATAKLGNTAAAVAAAMNDPHLPSNRWQAAEQGSPASDPPAQGSSPSSPPPASLAAAVASSLSHQAGPGVTLFNNPLAEEDGAAPRDSSKVAAKVASPAALTLPASVSRYNEADSPGGPSPSGPYPDQGATSSDSDSDGALSDETPSPLSSSPPTSPGASSGSAPKPDFMASLRGPARTSMAALRDAALQEERRQQQHSREEDVHVADDDKAPKSDALPSGNPWFPSGVSAADLLPSPFAVSPVLVGLGGGRKGSKGNLHPRRSAPEPPSAGSTSPSSRASVGASPGFSIEGGPFAGVRSTFSYQGPLTSARKSSTKGITTAGHSVGSAGEQVVPAGGSSYSSSAVPSSKGSGGIEESGGSGAAAETSSASATQGSGEGPGTLAGNEKLSKGSVKSGDDTADASDEDFLHDRIIIPPRYPASSLKGTAAESDASKQPSGNSATRAGDTKGLTLSAGNPFASAAFKGIDTPAGRLTGASYLSGTSQEGAGAGGGEGGDAGDDEQHEEEEEEDAHEVEDEYDDNVFDEEEEEEEEENEEGGHLHMTNAEVQKLTLEVGQLKEEVGKQTALNAGLRGELRKFTDMVAALQAQLRGKRPPPGAPPPSQPQPLPSSPPSSMPAPHMSTSPAKPEAGDTSPAAPPKPPPPPGLDAAQRLALYRDALNQSAFIASGALKEELLAAQEVLKGKEALEPGIEKVVLIKLQKIVSAGADATRRLDQQSHSGGTRVNSNGRIILGGMAGGLELPLPTFPDSSSDDEHQASPGNHDSSSLPAPQSQVDDMTSQHSRLLQERDAVPQQLQGGPKQSSESSSDGSRQKPERSTFSATTTMQGADTSTPGAEEGSASPSSLSSPRSRLSSPKSLEVADMGPNPPVPSLSQTLRRASSGGPSPEAVAAAVRADAHALALLPLSASGSGSGRTSLSGPGRGRALSPNAQRLGMESAEAAGWKFERQILLRRISDLEAEAKALEAARADCLVKGALLDAERGHMGALHKQLALALQEAQQLKAQLEQATGQVHAGQAQVDKLQAELKAVRYEVAELKGIIGAARSIIVGLRQAAPAAAAPATQPPAPPAISTNHAASLPSTSGSSHGSSGSSPTPQSPGALGPSTPPLTTQLESQREQLQRLEALVRVREEELSAAQASLQHQGQELAVARAAVEEAVRKELATKEELAALRQQAVSGGAGGGMDASLALSVERSARLMDTLQHHVAQLEEQQQVGSASGVSAGLRAGGDMSPSISSLPSSLLAKELAATRVKLERLQARYEEATAQLAHLQQTRAHIEDAGASGNGAVLAGVAALQQGPAQGLPVGASTSAPAGATSSGSASEASRLRLAALLQLVAATEAKLKRASPSKSSKTVAAQGSTQASTGLEGSPSGASVSAGPAATSAQLLEENAMLLGLDALAKRLEKRVRSVLLAGLEAQQELRGLARQVAQVQGFTPAAAGLPAYSPLPRSTSANGLGSPGDHALSAAVGGSVQGSAAAPGVRTAWATPSAAYVPARTVAPAPASPGAQWLPPPALSRSSPVLASASQLGLQAAAAGTTTSGVPPPVLLSSRQADTQRDLSAMGSENSELRRQLAAQAAVNAQLALQLASMSRRLEQADAVGSGATPLTSSSKGPMTGAHSAGVSAARYPAVSTSSWAAGHAGLASMSKVSQPSRSAIPEQRQQYGSTLASTGRGDWQSGLGAGTLQTAAGSRPPGGTFTDLYKTPSHMHASPSEWHSPLIVGPTSTHRQT